ncbi:hypothetical protein L4L53_29585, partial [Klebsiella pneumoniae]|uniref:hypothetical protein n=1 Tax=Klebsiella pneumoniae TaxID=573 RepID=UPI001F2C7818
GHILSDGLGEPLVADAAILMERRFEEGGDGVTYRVGLNVLLEGEARYFEMANALLPALALAASDVVRAVRLDAERGVRRPVSVEVEATGEAAE